MTTANNFHQSIIKNNTIGAQEDEWTGAIFVLVDGRELYCSPNWQESQNDITFEYDDEDGNTLFWERYTMFTGDTKADVKKWQEIVLQEINKIKSNK